MIILSDSYGSSFPAVGLFSLLLRMGYTTRYAYFPISSTSDKNHPNQGIGGLR